MKKKRIIQAGRTTELEGKVSEGKLRTFRKKNNDGILCPSMSYGVYLSLLPVCSMSFLLVLVFYCCVTYPQT